MAGASPVPPGPGRLGAARHGLHYRPAPAGPPWWLAHDSGLREGCLRGGVPGHGTAGRVVARCGGRWQSRSMAAAYRRPSCATSRLRGQLRAVVSSPRRRLGLEIALALVAGVAVLRHARGSEEARGVLADEQVALRRVATLVARHPSPPEVFAAVTEEAGKLLHLDTAQLLVYGEDGTATAVGTWGQLAAQLPVGTRVPLEGDNIIVRVWHTQQPVRIDDYANAPGPAAGHARLVGVRGAVGTPIAVEGRLWGVMAIGSARPEPLPAGTELRLGAFMDLVATAIANTEARKELEQVAADQAALRRVATLVAEAVPPGEVFTAVAEEAAGLFGVPLVGLFRYEAEGVATIIAGAGKGSPYVGRRWTFPAGDPSVVASLQRTGQPLRIDDYTQVEGAVTAEARELGITAAAGVPVIVNGKTWGSVELATGRDHPPLPADILGRLAAFTDLVATAIANSDARAELAASRARIVTAADETRRRLERDLHDGIQSRLVSLGLKARTIETMTPRPADDIQRELSLLADGLGTSLDELREISRGIHPAILSEAGLGPALKALARRSAVPVKLDLNLGARPGEHLEVAAYYVASEALTNAAKHAQASVIDIRADGHDGALTLWIHDNGIGGADPSRGSGIIGLKDRVEALGGTISILSPRGHGTTLHVQLPAGPSAAPTPPVGTP